MAERDMSDIVTGESARIDGRIAQEFGERGFPQRIVERRARMERELQHRVEEDVGGYLVWKLQREYVAVIANAREQPARVRQEVGSLELDVVLQIHKLSEADTLEGTMGIDVGASPNHRGEPEALHCGSRGAE